MVSLSTPWSRRHRPVMALTPDRLIVSKGQNFQVYDIAHSSNDVKKRKFRTRHVVTLPGRPETALLDVTGIAVVHTRNQAPDSTTLVVGRENGTLARFSIPQTTHERHEAEITATYTMPRAARGSPIKCLTSSGSTILVLSSNGVISLLDAASPWLPSSSFSLPNGCIPWSAYVSLSSSTPFALIGASKPRPLAMHPFLQGQGGLASEPIALLDDGTDEIHSPAAYALCQPDAGSAGKVPFVWGSSDQVIVSGWHDGEVRVHDLRAGDSRIVPSSSPTPMPSLMRPVMTLSDPESDAGAIYCIAIGGGSGSQIVAGQALHGCISVWDVRHPITNRPRAGVNGRGSVSRKDRLGLSGWSVYRRASSWSPTYDLILEGFRLWGVDQTGPFLLDFGPRLTSVRASATLMTGRNVRRATGYAQMPATGQRAVVYDHRTQEVVIS